MKRRKSESIVSVSGGLGPYENIRKALAALDLKPLKNKRVLIKPNAGRHVPAARGITTHPKAVEAVIDAAREAGAAAVAVGESPILGVKTMAAFESTGIAAAARAKGVPLIDMDVRRPVPKKITRGRILKSLKICADMFDFDFIISLPVVKSHMHTQVTLGIKNMKGCLWRHEKVRLHQLQYPRKKEFPEKTLDSAISDMAKILLPDLTVIDGYIGLEGLGPSSGQAVRSDFAVASYNPLAADKTCCELMGFAFEDVVHLRLVRDRKIVPLDGIRTVPHDFMRFARPYKPAPAKLEFEFPDIVVHEKSACSACLSTTLLFLKRFANELGDYVLKDGKIHLAMGKDADGLPPGTILIGNCTSKHKAKGRLVLGCPPVASRIFKAITGVEPETNEPEPQ